MDATTVQRLKTVCGALALSGVACCGNAQPPLHANFEQSDVSAPESRGKIQFAVNLDAPVAVERRLTLRYSGTADLDRDFTGPAEVTFVPNAKQATFEIEISKEGEAECPETAVIDLAGSDGMRRRVTISITDEDAAGRRLRVGSPNGFLGVNAASRLAQPGDVIEIAEGDYAGDVAVLRTDDLVICGLGRGAHILAAGKSVEGKGIWVVKSNRVRIENVHFSGAKVSDKNGAGIRVEGADLTVRHARFVDNENGILAGEKPDSTITIEHSEFIHSGAGDGRSHNIYIGKIGRLVARFNVFRDAYIGHNIKSRARESIIEYNRVMDGANGKASYQIDLPNGGRALLLGNLIQQGPEAENWTMASYGAEGIEHPDNALVMAHNTVVNDRHSGMFVQAHKETACVLVNNLFAGKGDMQCNGGARMANVTIESGFIDRKNYDYHVKAGTASIDAGVPAETQRGFATQPRYEIWFDDAISRRVQNGAADVGAYEFRP